MKESFFKTELEAFQFLFWVEALRSGVFNQARLTLEIDDSFCCLGVGECITNDNPFLHNGHLSGCLPAKKSFTNRIYEEHLSRIRYSNEDGRSLMYLNDTARWTFNQIADELMRVFGPDLDNFYANQPQP